MNFQGQGLISQGYPFAIYNFIEFASERFNVCPMLNAIEREVCDICDQAFSARDRIMVLEAGCGSASHLEFKPAVDVVGIDNSVKQLERNTFLQKKILGDIQDYPLPRQAFDAVVCWWVLEHLARPNDALVNLFGSVKQEGLLVLAFSNLLSAKGLVTKFTPFWFHVLFYRVMKFKSRPFPTYLRLAIMPGRVVRLAQSNGFSVLLFRLVEGTMTRRTITRSWLIGRTFSVVDFVIQMISFGRLGSLSLDSCVMVLRKD